MANGESLNNEERTNVDGRKIFVNTQGKAYVENSLSFPFIQKVVEVTPDGVAKILDKNSNN